MSNLPYEVRTHRAPVAAFQSLDDADIYATAASKRERDTSFWVVHVQHTATHLTRCVNGKKMINDGLNNV